MLYDAVEGNGGRRTATERRPAEAPSPGTVRLGAAGLFEAEVEWPLRLGRCGDGTQPEEKHPGCDSQWLRDPSGT